MVVVNDYSNLSSEEARAKVIHLQHRIFAEQFHKQFFVRDPRPEYFLKYEIAAFLEGRIDEFHGWNDPLGQALDFVYDRLTAWFWDFWYWTIRPGIEWILDGFRWIWDSAVSWARDAYKKAADVWYKVMDVYNYVRYTVYSTLRDVWNMLAGIGSTIYSRVREAINVVWSWLLQLWHNYIQPGVRYILNGFRWLWEQAAAFAQQAVTWAQNAYNTIKDAWDDIVEQVSGAFERLSKQMAALPQAIASGFQSAISYLKDVFTAIWNDVLVPFGKGLIESLQWIASQLEQAFITTWNSIHDILASFAPVTPDRAENLGITLLKIAGLSAGGLLAMTGVWDLMHPIKDVIPGEIKAMLYDVTNFKMILGALSGALVTAAIAQPAKYSYNALLRPYLPSWGDVMELRSRAAIGDEEFIRMMRYHGYDESWKPWFDELANTPVRYFGLAAVARTGYFDEGFFKEELDRSGYSARAKQVMLQMYAQTAQEATRGYYGSVVISRYREGIIDRDGLSEELRMLGYPERLRKQLITGAELYYDLDTVKDYVSAVRQAYRRGKRTIDELRAELAGLGLREDRIARIVAVELARAKEDVGTTQEEEVRAYGRSTVIKRFREGLITPLGLENELRMLGYSPQWIERLRQVALLERDYDFAMTVLSYVKTAYRRKKIDDTRFIEILRSFGFIDDKIKLELSLLKLAYGLGLEEEEVVS